MPSIRSTVPTDIESLSPSKIAEFSLNITDQPLKINSTLIKRLIDTFTHNSALSDPQKATYVYSTPNAAGHEIVPSNISSNLTIATASADILSRAVCSSLF